MCNNQRKTKFKNMSAYDRALEQWIKKHKNASSTEISAFKDGYMSGVMVCLNNEK